MALRIPLNQTVTSKYTSDGEYVIESTYAKYKGYYYELSGKLFAGKEYDPNAPVIIKVTRENANSLLTNKSTYLYGLLSGIKLSNTKPVSHIFQKTNPNERYADRYFIQRVNDNPPLIKEINKDTYEQFQTDPLYKSTTIKWDTIGSNEQTLTVADKQFPGIKSFLEELNYSPFGEDDNQLEEYSSSLSIIIPPSPPLVSSGSVTDTPKPQDIIPVGPTIIGNISTPFYIPPAVPSAPVLENLFVTSRTSGSAVIEATVVSTTNSTINRIGTSYNTTPGFLYNNALDTGGTSLGAFSQNRTGLSPETFYYYFAYAMNNDGFTGSIGESAFWSLSNPPTAQATNLVAVTGSSTEIRLSWTPATFPGSGAYVKEYVLLRSIYPNTPSLANVNGQAPLAGANTTIEYEGISSVSSSYTASGLTSNTTYTFMLIPYTDGDAGRFNCYNYLTASAPTASASLSAPPTCTADSYALGDPYNINVGGTDILVGYVYYKDTCNIYVVGPDDLYAFDTTTVPELQLGGAQWGCSGLQILSIFTGGDTSIGGGEVNTTDIRSSGCPPTDYSPFAAQLSYDYRNVVSGYTWSLPTIGDWAQIYAVKAQLIAAGANLSSVDYWSSNENGKTNAYTVNPQTGAQTATLKTAVRNVRPVTIIPNP